MKNTWKNNLLCYYKMLKHTILYETNAISGCVCDDIFMKCLFMMMQQSYFQNKLLPESHL